MSNHLREIDVDGLRIGMYVAELDRPWLETPFLFQGFFIRAKSEIEELRQHCDFVLIDLEETDDKLLGPAKPLKSAKISKTASDGTAKKQSPWRRFIALFWRRKVSAIKTPAPGEFYQDTASVADELVVARSVHSGSLREIMHTLERIRNGGTLQMPELEVVTETMVDSVLRNSMAMALLARIREKDDQMYAHSISTSIWALVFGRHLGLNRESLKAVGLGALLLDVGKTKLPIDLLAKKGELTIVEKSYVRSHVELGLDVIRKTEGVDARVLDMVATHHERFDGSGYPKKLFGNQIPVFGRIGGIVDSYSAMTAETPYAPAMSSYDAMREFKALSDKSFQSEMVEQFIQAIGIFPAGTLVELNTGEIAVVLKEHRLSRLQPELAVIFGPDKEELTDFRILDLLEQGTEPGTRPKAWIERGLKPGAYNIDPSKYFL